MLLVLSITKLRMTEHDFWYNTTPRKLHAMLHELGRLTSGNAAEGQVVEGFIDDVLD